jgi:transketolase
MSEVEANSGRITQILNRLSKRSGKPLSTLKLNAKILRSLNLIRYREGAGAELSELGRFILELLKEEQWREDWRAGLPSSRVPPRELAAKIKALRRRVLKMLEDAGSGHLASSLSSLTIIATLYLAKMRHDPRNPEWRLRDRFLLGKGHAAPALYAVLAECGYFPEEELSRLRCVGGLLQGHPEASIPGVDSASGSLGQCLSVANGMALAAKMRGEPYRVYVLLGDGELEEGQIWEAAMSGARHRLDNLTVIVDRNGHQLTGPTELVKPLEPLAEKWRAFGWEVLEVDGESPEEILRALTVGEEVKGRPTVILALTRRIEPSTKGERRGAA